MKRLCCGCLLILLLVIGCDGYEAVITGLGQASANEALVLLREHNIDAKKEAEPSKKLPLFQIKVKTSQSIDALRLLVDHRLPKTERASLKDIYPPGASGLIPTKSEEHARFLMASQGEVEALFKIIPGVTDARVVLSFEPPNDLLKNGPPKTASVVLLYQSNSEDRLPISDEEAKNLISSSINGLLPDNVTIVQKPIANVAMLFPAPIAAEDEEKYLVWYMLALTSLALLVAFYGVFRLFVQRRTQTVLAP